MLTKWFKVKEGKLAYMESKTEGFPVLLVHGNSLSAQTFTHQFNDEVLSNYRLIAFDFPSHGQTGSWPDPHKHYNPAFFVELLVAFVNELQIGHGLFVGHSFGGHILLNASPYLPMAAGFVFFGATPFGNPPAMDKAFLPNPALPLLFKADRTEEETLLVARALVANENEIPETLFQSMVQSVSEVRTVIGSAIANGSANNEMRLLHELDKPVALFHGANDKLVSLPYLQQLSVPNLWEKEIKCIENAGHCPQLETPQEFNRLLLAFLKTLTESK